MSGRQDGGADARPLLTRKRMGALAAIAVGGAVLGVGAGALASGNPVGEILGVTSQEFSCPEYFAGELADWDRIPASWGVSSPPEAGCVYVSVDDAGKATFGAYYPYADAGWVEEMRSWARANGFSDRSAATTPENGGAGSLERGAVDLVLTYQLGEAQQENVFGLRGGDPLGVVIVYDSPW